MTKERRAEIEKLIQEEIRRRKKRKPKQKKAYVDVKEYHRGTNWIKRHCVKGHLRIQHKVKAHIRRNRSK